MVSWNASVKNSNNEILDEKQNVSSLDLGYFLSRQKDHVAVPFWDNNASVKALLISEISRESSRINEENYGLVPNDCILGLLGKLRSYRHQGKRSDTVNLVIEHIETLLDFYQGGNFQSCRANVDDIKSVVKIY